MDDAVTIVQQVMMTLQMENTESKYQTDCGPSPKDIDLADRLVGISPIFQEWRNTLAEYFQVARLDGRAEIIKAILVAIPSTPR